MFGDEFLLLGFVYLYLNSSLTRMDLVILFVWRSGILIFFHMEEFDFVLAIKVQFQLSF